MKSIFATNNPNQPTPPPTPEPEEDTTKTEENTTEPETPEVKPDPPTEPMVRMPDGTEIPASTYVGTHLEAQRNILGGESEPAPKEKETPSEPATPTWKVDVDDANYQSDVEKSLAQGHNALGEEMTEEMAGVKSAAADALTEVKEMRKEAAEDRAQRQIEDIEKTSGVTEAEMQAVYKEFNGQIDSIPALAEIAASRKEATKSSEERTQAATEERKKSVANVSGGGQSQSSSGSDDQPKGRGLTGKDLNSGAAIAAKYSAFSQ